MPRKGTKLPIAGGQIMDALVVRQEQSLQQREAEIQRIEALFQFKDSYERLTEESKIDFYNLAEFNVIFEKGKSLLRMQAHEGRGGLEQIIENHRMSRREAFYAMAVAEKIGPHQKQFEEFAKSKLFLMSQLDEPDIKTIADGGEVDGINLEKAKSMSYRELLHTYQKEKKERTDAVDALEDVVSQKEKKINELERDLRRLPKPTEEDMAIVKLKEYRDPIIDNILSATERIKRATAAIDAAQKIPHIPFDALEELIGPWKGNYQEFLDEVDDFCSAFSNIHVDKGRG